MPQRSMDHARDVSGRFTAAASTYAGIAQLQERVAIRVLDMVPAGFAASSILDAGCGTGALIRLARTRWPAALCTGVDIAPGMIAEASARLGTDPSVRLVTADIGRFAPPTPFDLVVSSSALHWLRPFAAGLARTVEMVRTGGLCAIGIMLDGTLGELHASRRAVAPDKTPPGRLPAADEFEAALRCIPGTRIRRLERSVTEFDQTSAMDVVRTVHAMGVTGGDLSRADAPLTRGELMRTAGWYDTHYATPGGVRVTFVVGYALVERD